MDAGAGRAVTSALRIVTRRLIDLCRLRLRVTLVVLLNLICVIWIGLFCRPPGSKPFQNSCHFQNWNTALRRLAACGNKAEHGCTTTILFRSSDIKVISAFECVDGEVA